ncbi:MAG: hypothetical protein AAF270_02120 [Pseudomonadota bacterium]
MNNNDYLLPGIAALILALLFPSYWIIEAVIVEFDFASLQVKHSTGVMRLVFALTGALAIAVYMGLKQQLIDHHNYRGVDIVLALIIGVCVVFYGGVLVVEMLSPMLGEVNGELILSIIWIGGIMTFGVLDIVLGALLLKERRELPGLLRGFAIVNLIMGVFEVTLIFAFLTILIYPIALILLALNFLRQPEAIEIV